MAEVKSYQVRIWGGTNGFSGEGRARIQLNDATFALGWIYFHDAGATIPADFKMMNTTYNREQIHMHLPASALNSVVDLLRNESPVFFTFAFNSGVLTTGSEPAGEGEKS